MTILTINLIWLMLLQGMCLGVDSWRAVIVKSQNDYETGRLPGEGMQYPRSMVRSYSDPNYIYWAHDCGPGWRSKNAGETWERFLAKGVGTVFGKSIEVDPANPNTVLMIIDNQWDTSEVYFHGLYKSTDGGDNWSRVLSLSCNEQNRSYKHLIAYALSTISGGEAKVWYAAFTGHNIYKSTDGGNNWSPEADISDANHTINNVLYVSSTDSNTFYLGSNGGLYRSTDGGSTINPLGDLPSGEVATIQIDLNDPNVLYVAVKNKGAYKSTNAGTNFAAIKTDNTTIGLSVNPGNTNVMYFLKTSAIYVSQDGGSSWSTVISHPREGLGRTTDWGNSIVPWDGIGAIIPNPKISGEAVGYGEAYLWKTTNCIDFYNDSNLFGGYTWTIRDGMLFDPCNLNRFGLFGADKGLFISENAGKYYNYLATPYSILTNWGYAGNSNDMKAGAFQPGTSAFVAAGGGIWGFGVMGIVWSSGDTGPWVTTTIDGVNWNANDPNFRGPYRHYFYRPADPNILFTTDVKSTDGGKTFTHISFLVNNGLQIYGMSKSNPNVLYAMNSTGTDIYRSTDGGDNWSLYVHKTWYAYASGAVNTYDLLFDIDPVDCNKIYTMYSGGDIASFDGANWHPFGLLSYIRSLPANSLLVSLDPQAAYPAIGAVIVDPNNNSVIYATVCHPGVSPVYRSINGGSTWEDISYNLPRSNYGPAFSINPYSGEIFVGGASGTWVFPPPYNQNTPIYTNSVQTLVLNAIGNKSVSENSLLTFTVNASDADGDAITYSATGLPSGATFVGQTFSWTPDYNQAGSYQVTFIASDGKAQDSNTITITVNNVNRPPVLAAIGNKSVNENSTLSFSISATDADGDTITYSAQNLPSGATFVGQTFSWTPDYNQAGSYQVTFIASDGNAQDSNTITITVNNVNRPPSTCGYWQ